MRRSFVASATFGDLPLLRHDLLEVIEKVSRRIGQLLGNLGDDIFRAPGFVFLFIVFNGTRNPDQLDVVVEGDLLGLAVLLRRLLE